jgi:hypothetical protein
MGQVRARKDRSQENTRAEVELRPSAVADEAHVLVLPGIEFLEGGRANALHDPADQLFQLSGQHAVPGFRFAFSALASEPYRENIFSTVAMGR